jgi:glycosyltransferase involved in cell wall biosynthesis
MPKVSVLMAVYNGEAYLRNAIDSILHQTYSDFEFIIIDDGSTDNSFDILNTYREQDARINLHRQANRGLAASLNTGLDLAHGEYIARMDADDISMPQRLTLQTSFMDAHTDIGICGGAMKTIGNAPEQKIIYPFDADAALCELLFKPPVAHPTVMIRKAVLDDHQLRYNPNITAAQDYELWSRVSRVTRITNVQDVLLGYRISDNQVTRTRRTEQIAHTQSVHHKLLGELGLSPTLDELNLHFSLAAHQFDLSPKYIQQVNSWLLKLMAANDTSPMYPLTPFKQHLARYWYMVCGAGNTIGFPVWQMFRRSPLYQFISLKRKVWLFARCIIAKQIKRET